MMIRFIIVYKNYRSFFKNIMAKKLSCYDTSCKAALEQIERERYAEVLEEDEMETILKYGILP